MANLRGRVTSPVGIRTKMNAKNYIFFR